MEPNQVQVMDELGNNNLAPQSTLYLGQMAADYSALSPQKKNFTSNQTQVKPPANIFANQLDLRHVQTNLNPQANF